MTKRELIDQKIDNAKAIESQINSLLLPIKQDESCTLILNIEEDRIKIGLAINMDVLEMKVSPIQM